MQNFAYNNEDGEPEVTSSPDDDVYDIHDDVYDDDYTPQIEHKSYGSPQMQVLY